MSVIKTTNRKKMLVLMVTCTFLLIVLIVRSIYIMVFCQEYYENAAIEVHQRERDIKAARGQILDRNNTPLAVNKTVCTISVIHNQIKDRIKVIDSLSSTLNIDKKEIEKKVDKLSVREKIKSNVSKEVGDKIRNLNLQGVKVDEDYKRYYLYDDVASKVIGFTGGDNQGIIGLETKYEKYLKGTNGKILTLTDAAGRELQGALESRKESIPGMDLKISIDLNIQKYASQLARNVLEAKQANYVSIIAMNPQNGEIYAMVNEPEYNLNDPYNLNFETIYAHDSKEYKDSLNKMWRNQCINDTYEPGSTFKIVTATAGLEEKVVDLNSTFNCPGYRIVEDRKIRCHKTTGHGTETFLQGVMNSCNPVFMDVGARVGVKNFYKYFDKLGFMEKTGVDLPGEAGIILHQQKNVGPVELATMSFGQSFQITPISLIRAVSCVINGGKLVTPHFAIETIKDDCVQEKFSFKEKNNRISNETSKTMKYILENVVANGSGKKGAVEGFSVGGKTATSQKLPRGSGKYISSFIGFSPADNPKIIAMAIIDEPKGIYYGGTIAAPIIKSLFENVLPYLG